MVSYSETWARLCRQLNDSSISDNFYLGGGQELLLILLTIIQLLVHHNLR